MNGIDAVVFDLGNVLIAVDEPRAAERMAARTGKTRQQIEEYIRGTPHGHELAMGKLSTKQFFPHRGQGPRVRRRVRRVRIDLE